MDLRDLSRRDILAAIGAAGGGGLVLGTATGAVLADEESLVDNLLGAGGLDLVVDWSVVGGPSGSSEGTAQIEIPIDNETRSGSATLSVGLPPRGTNNPAYAWLRLSCPPSSRLNDALDVTLRYDCGNGGVVLAQGTLVEVANALRNGVVLDGNCDGMAAPGFQECLHPGDPVDLRLEWTLDDDFAGKASTSIGVDVAGRQCRRQPGTTNPFPSVPTCVERYGVSYIEIFAMVDDECVSVGKIELEDNYCGQPGIDESYIEPGTYTLYPEAGECSVDTGYEVRVTETEEKDDGDGTETTAVAFELLVAGMDDGPDLCRVDVKGGLTTISYGEEDLDGNATDGLLSAPTKSGGGA